MREANSGIALTPAELPIRRCLDSRLNLARKARALILEVAFTRSNQNVRQVPGSVGDDGEKKSTVDLVCAKTTDSLCRRALPVDHMRSYCLSGGFSVSYHKVNQVL